MNNIINASHLVRCRVFLFGWSIGNCILFSGIFEMSHILLGVFSSRCLSLPMLCTCISLSISISVCLYASISLCRRNLDHLPLYWDMMSFSGGENSCSGVHFVFNYLDTNITEKETDTVAFCEDGNKLCLRNIGIYLVSRLCHNRVHG